MIFTPQLLTWLLFASLNSAPTSQNIGTSDAHPPQFDAAPPPVTLSFSYDTNAWPANQFNQPLFQVPCWIIQMTESLSPMEQWSNIWTNCDGSLPPGAISNWWQQPPWTPPPGYAGLPQAFFRVELQ